MTSVISRQRSRRRLAALTFLSNISLDGTHRDTNLGRYYDTGKNIEEQNEENSFNLVQASKCSNEENLHVDSNLTQKSHSHILDVEEDLEEKVVLDEAADLATVLKKLNSHLHFEKKNVFSSTESIGPLSGGFVSKKRNFSGTLSETSGSTSKEVRELSPHSLSRIKGERLVFVSKLRVPLHIFSSLSFIKASKPDFNPRETVRKRHASGNRPVSVVSVSTDPAHILGITCFEDATEISFSDLLVPSRHFHRPKRHWSENVDGGLSDVSSEKVMVGQFSHPAIARCFSYEPATHKATAHYIPYAQGLQNSREDRGGGGTSGFNNDFYIPNVLDDPELRAGKHRKLLQFPSYLTSVIDYTKSFELKKELNDKFKDKFPHINLSLSKLRSLKRELLKIALNECDMNLLTVAQSYVYFEKMIQKMYVNKSNRKLIAGACLLLAAKMNDVKGEALTNLIEKIEIVFRLNRKELLSWELATMVALEFGLHIPVWQVNPHFQRLMFES